MTDLNKNDKDINEKNDEKVSSKNVVKKYYYGVGSRKSARARVRIFAGKGEIVINDKKAEFYLEKPFIKIILSPLILTHNLKKFDISIKVSGGGKHSQAEAIRHGISRGLVVYKNELKTTLKKSGYLTRDPREKERKKYGLKRARKAPQYRKR